MNFNDRFSIGHYDRFHNDYASVYYTIMKNADPRFLANIHDIYFGKYFYYEYNGDRKSTRLNSSHSQQSRMPSSA